MNHSAATDNVINLDARNIGSFFGPLASKYAYTPILRSRLDELFRASGNSSNRFFVLDGPTCIAAQSTRTGALRCMRSGCVLVCVYLSDLYPVPRDHDLSSYNGALVMLWHALTYLQTQRDPSNYPFCAYQPLEQAIELVKEKATELTWREA